jgi:tRNA A37 threonylcarbamoyladenosine dehydratase
MVGGEIITAMDPTLFVRIQDAEKPSKSALSRVVRDSLRDRMSGHARFANSNLRPIGVGYLSYNLE